MAHKISDALSHLSEAQLHSRRAELGSNGVYAAGIINSEFNVSGGSYCLFQMMTVMQQQSGFRLLTR